MGAQRVADVAGGLRQRPALVYVEPRPGLPAKAGDTLFEGRRSSRLYSGRAYLFSSVCGAIGYDVSGTIGTDETTVILQGSAPR